MSVFAEFSLPVTAFPPGGRLRAYPDAVVDLEETVPTGSVTHYFWVVDDEYDRLVEDLRTDSSVESVTVLDELDDRALVRIHWNDVTPVLELIAEHGAILAEATGSGNGWSFTLRFPNQDALSEFYEACHGHAIALELRSVSEAGFSTSDDDELTLPQRETVVAAFEAGYFDVPRRTTIAELADQLGISDQAVSERLRRGLRKFLAGTLRGEEDTDRDD